MDLKAHLGAKLKTARSSSGLTQEAFAEALGISGRTISAIESGRSLTSLTTLDQMAKTLKVPLSYFFVDYGTLQTKTCSKAERAIAEVAASLEPNEMTIALVLLRALKGHSTEMKKRSRK